MENQSRVHYVFGDSHSRLYGAESLSNLGLHCKVCYMGPVTMYRVGRDRLDIESMKSISRAWYDEYTKTAKPEYKFLKYPTDDNIKQGDACIFVFGEIDVRNHIHKQMIRQNTYHDTIVNDLATSYVDTIAQNAVNFPGVKFIIQSVIAPTDSDNIHQKDNEYPVIGSFSERLQINKALNNALLRQCNLHNIDFLDITTYYQNDDTEHPVPGIAPSCMYHELDSRVKDNSVHVHLNHAEGVYKCMAYVDLRKAQDEQNDHENKYKA